MNISILNKVVKIIKETIEKNGSHDRPLSYNRNKFVKLAWCISNANTLFTILEIGMYVKYKVIINTVSGWFSK